MSKFKIAKYDYRKSTKVPVQILDGGNDFDIAEANSKVLGALDGGHRYKVIRDDDRPSILKIAKYAHGSLDIIELIDIQLAFGEQREIDAAITQAEKLNRQDINHRYEIIKPKN